jgi:hypothetical protein
MDLVDTIGPLRVRHVTTTYTSAGPLAGRVLMEYEGTPVRVMQLASARWLLMDHRGEPECDCPRVSRVELWTADTSEGDVAGLMVLGHGRASATTECLTLDDIARAWRPAASARREFMHIA